MANYITDHGNNIPIRSSDPSNPILGEIWYNTTSRSLKGVASSNGTWSSGGNIPTSLYSNSGSGSTPAGFSMGGGTGPVPAYVSATNTYDGTSWTGAPAMTISSGYAGACGTIPTTMYVGGDGNPPGSSNTYDGSSWTGQPALGFDGYQIKAAGNSANAFAAMGVYSANGYNWNGSSWTSAGAVPQQSYNTTAIGTHNDVSFLAGYALPPGSSSNLHQNWNGSSWTTRTVVPIGGGTGGQGSNLSPTSDFWYQADKTNTLKWDGSSWATVGSMSTGRANGGSSGGSSSEGFIAGGNIPPHTTATEEFASGPQTVTFTTS